MPNVHVAVSSFGVASAVSVGHRLPVSYCPGGRRGSRFFPRPLNPRVKPTMTMPRFSASGDEGQVLVHGADRGRALADRGRHALHRSAADVTDREQTGLAGLE